MAFTVGVAGASGYAGGELLRLLSAHPQADIRVITAHSNADQPVSSVHPHLRSLAGRRFTATTAAELASNDVVFFALPHGQSGELAAEVAELNPDALLIDCGADHRLESEDDWAAFYGGEHPGTWVYGVPELPVPGGKQREHLKQARRIAAPGCNASTVALSLAPGIVEGLVDSSDIVATLAVGPSGAGRSLKPQLLAAELLGNARPYSVAGAHRHIPEVKQAARWADAAGAPLGQDESGFKFAMAFTPVLIPVARGILATVSAPVEPGTTAEELHAAWDNWYGDEPFVQVLPLGEMPQLSDVIGANTALVGVALDKAAGRALIVTAIDNLVKGTAGAAIQSMNLALGLDETTGLTTNGVAP